MVAQVLFFVFLLCLLGGVVISSSSVLLKGSSPFANSIFKALCKLSKAVGDLFFDACHVISLAGLLTDLFKADCLLGSLVSFVDLFANA